MAMAIRLDRLLREGTICGQTDLVRMAKVTQPRTTRIMSLLHLAPDIQEELLFLPRATSGDDLIQEKMLRPIASETDWGRQRHLWERQRSSRSTPTGTGEYPGRLVVAAGNPAMGFPMLDAELLRSLTWLWRRRVCPIIPSAYIPAHGGRDSPFGVITGYSAMPRTAFINYRREDSGPEAKLIADALSRSLTPQAVFIDTEAIDLGEEWPDRIRAALADSKYVIVVVGPKWLLAGMDQWGRRRIDIESDWVRIEIGHALREEDNNPCADQRGETAAIRSPTQRYRRGHGETRYCDSA